MFNFERYNGDIKNIKTNRKGHFETTYLHKFLATVHGADYLYSSNISEESSGYAILYQLATNKKKTQKNLEKLEKHKKKTEEFDLNTFVISTHQKPTFIHGSEALPLSTIESIKLNQSTDLIRDMRLYNCIFNYYSSLIGLQLPFTLASLSKKIQKFKKIDILGQKYSSMDRGSYITAFFPGENQTLSLRPGQIQFFFCHEMNGDVFTFAYVKWYQPTQQNFTSHRLHGMDTWSNSFEDEDFQCILPVHRIYGPICIRRWLEEEGINVVTFIPRKINA